MVDHSVRTLRDTTKLLGAQGIISIFSIFYFIIITRLFTKVELASIAVLGVICGISAMLTGVGLSTTCIQKAPELIAKGGKNEACALIKASVSIPLVLSLLVAGIIFLTATEISQIFFKSSEFGMLIKIMALGVVIYKVHECLSHTLRAVQKFGKLSIANVMTNIGGRLLALPLYFILGIKGYIGGLIFAQGTVILYMVYQLKEYLFFKVTSYPIKELIRYSLPYYGDGFVRFGSMQADQLIIGVFLRPELLATYYVARRFFDYLVLYIDALLTAVVSKISELKAIGMEKVEAAFTKTSRYLTFSLMPVSSLIAAISYPLLRIYGGEKYIGATPVLVLLSLVSIAYGLYSLYAINVYILGKPVERFKQESVSSILNVLLGLGLVIPFNIFGLAIARCFSLSGALLFSRYLLKKLSKAKFDILALKQTLFASLLMATVIIIAQFLYYNIFVVPVYILAGTIVYLFFFCKGLRIEDIELIRKFLPVRVSPLLIRPVYFFGGTKLKKELAQN